MVQTTATVREGRRAEGAEPVLPRREIERLGLSSGALVTLEVQAAETPDDERTLREAIDEVDRGGGVTLSDADLRSMRQEIASLAAQSARGGTSPTLERLIQDRIELVRARDQNAR